MKGKDDDQNAKGVEKTFVPPSGRFFQTMLAAHSHNQIYGEIVRQLKTNNARPAKTSVHSERKVRIRTEKYYKGEHCESQWKDKYQRNVIHKSCGFYTPSYTPYSSVGHLNLDLRDLVFESLGRDKTKTEKSEQVRNSNCQLT